MSDSAYRRHRIESLEARLPLDASMLQISEFFAHNDSVLFDAEGDDSDWIEIYNSGVDAVDLDGLYLTDDSADLTKWVFPADNIIAPGEFLVVFASGKDTVLADNELHTSFSLSGGGEYLGLVDADGATVIDAFAPGFPPQLDDISYGIEMTTSAAGVTLLDEGAQAKGLIPTNNLLGFTWNESDFDDGAWPITGPTGFGYENNPGAGTNFVDEIGTEVPSGTTTLYYRVPFNVASKEGLGSLTLNLRFDDGFVAYINGVRVAEAFAPTVLDDTSTAQGGQPDSVAEQFTSFDVSAAIPHINLGSDNVLAIHALNVNNSSDMLSSPQLVAFDSEIVQPEAIGHFTVPTPGWGNAGESVTGYAIAPEFSVPHGFYETTQSVEITTATSGGLIVYTTDGSEPAVDANLNIINGTEYTSALPISSTTTLRATTFKLDFESSFVTASTYIFLDDVIQQSPNGEAPTPDWPSSNVNGQDIDYGIDPQIIDLYGAQQVKDSLASLTTFSITTDLDNLFDENSGIYVNAGNRGRDWERASTVELIDPTGVDSFTVNAGLRIRGGFSRTDNNPKHAFRFFFRGEYGDTKLNYPLFGDDGADEFDVLDLRTSQNYSWAFQNNSQNTFVREVFARDLQRDIGHESTRSRYHHLYVNGVYWGLFMTQERIQDHFGESYFGGDETDYDVVKSNNAGGYVFEVADGNDQAWRQLYELAEGLSTNPVGNADNYWIMQGLNPDGTRNNDLPVLLDVDNVIDYMLIIFYTGGFDTGISRFLGDNRGNNWQGMYNRTAADEGFQFFIHDNEHSLGTNNTDDIDRTGPFLVGSNHTTYPFFNPGFLHQDLLSSPEYIARFADRAELHLSDGGAMTPEASIARLTKRIEQVDPAIIAASARWGDSKRNSPFTKATWQNEINSIVNQYFPVRTDTVIQQLTNDGLLLFLPLDEPSFNHPGGNVPAGFALEMSAPEGRPVYTLDGTDPRNPDGTVNRASIEIYNEPIPINGTQTIKARAFDVGLWSELVTATFIAPLAGDYNGDGVVDGGDLTVWETQFGSQGALAADGNGDGVVDGVDFLALQRNHGAGAGAAVQAASAATDEQLVAAQSETIAAVTVDVAYFVSPALTGAPLHASRPQWRPSGRDELAAPTSHADLDQALAAVEFYRRSRRDDWTDLAAELPAPSRRDQAEAATKVDRFWSAIEDQAAESLDETIGELVSQRG